METTASFGYWVRRRRKALDLTQAALAELVGCAPVTIKKIEWDERRPSRLMAERLADSLQILADERDRFIECGLGRRPVDSLPFLDERHSQGEATPGAAPPLPEIGGFVGRERELAQLRQHLKATLQGNGRVAFVVGEAGQGKTALLAAFAHRIQAEHRELAVAYGQCSAYAGGGDPYLPFRDALRTLAGDTGGYEAAGAQSREEVFEQYTRTLHRLTEQRPLLLLLDDLQWADTASVNLLFHLSRRLAAKRILMVGAYRPSEVAASATVTSQRHPLTPIVNEAVRTFGEVIIDLGRFEPSADRHFVDALLDREPNVLDEVFRVALFWRTKGQPLFTLELLQELQTRGDLVLDEAGRWAVSPTLNWNLLPTRVEAVISQRIGRLDAELRDTLAVASVEGEIFTAEAVASVRGVGRRALLHQLSQELERRHALVREQGEIKVDGQHLTRYQFRHVLFQQYLYGQVGQGERRLLHGEVAAALETLYVANKDEMAVPLARHYSEAGNAEKAVEYLLQAADRARAVYAHEQAADLYRQALEFLRKRGDHEGVAVTLMKLGQTYHTAFDYERARQAYEEGFALWQQMGKGQPEIALPPAPHPLRLVWQDPPSLDPTMGGYNLTAPITTQLFSSLVAHNPEMEVVPDVARRWEIVGGGRKYLFHLRDDVFWSDGMPVTARDFEFTFKRALDPTTQAPVAGSLLYAIRGAKAFHQGRLSDSGQVGVYAPDERTLVFELEEPATYFLQDLSYYVLLPVPRHVVEKHGSTWAEPAHIVTNGPFRLAAWERGQTMLLERNPLYHGRFTGNLEQVRLTLRSNPLDQIGLYQSGKIDVAYSWAIPGVALDPLRRQYTSEFISRPRFAVLYYVTDVSRPPLDNPLVRHALAMAIDRQALAEVVYKGYDQPGTGGFVPPGMPGYSENIGLPYDPDQARALLAEAGFPEGRHLPELILDVYAMRLAVGEFVQAQWQSHLNLNVRLEMVVAGTLLDWTHGSHISIGGWWADYADPDNFLRVDVQLDVPQWRDETYERLLEQARQTTDQADRMTFYQAADRVLMQAAAVVPLVYSPLYLMLKPWVKRFPTAAIKNPGFWKDVIIEPHQGQPV